MNAPATPTSALVMMPRVDPANWRASQDGPASRSKRTPAAMPMTRTRRNVTIGSAACMDQALRMAQIAKVAAWLPHDTPAVGSSGDRGSPPKLIRRDVRGSDHLAPAAGLVGDERR